MRIFIKRIIYHFALMVAISYPISFFISSNYHTHLKQNWLISLEKLELDYAVLGSSRVLNMIDIRSLDSTFGKKGINLGTSGSGYAENYIVLSEFLSKNTISTLILNTDEYSFNSKNSYSEPFHTYEFLPLFSKYYDVFSDHIPSWKLYLWKLLPITKYIEYNNRFHFKSSPYINNNMGSELLDITNKENELQAKRSHTTISEIDKKYFMKILQFCATKKIKVILITTPIFTKNGKYNNYVFNNYINSVKTMLNLNYYGFEELITNDHNYFRDQTHTNKLGSKEYSINLGEKLKSNKE